MTSTSVTAHTRQLATTTPSWVGVGLQWTVILLWIPLKITAVFWIGVRTVLLGTSLASRAIMDIAKFGKNMVKSVGTGEVSLISCLIFYLVFIFEITLELFDC